ncbi:uracil-DNA glycosylase-like protein [Schizophyllum fasciatum]
MDNFFAPPRKDGTTEPTPKKVKLTATASSSSVISSGSPAKASSLPPLNSIPFSVSAFVDSLTDEQKQLLRLEIECMNKVWLKVLKDEIKKPYFIALKRFLWAEGVHGPDDTPTPLKVYPAPCDIYAWSNTPLGRVKAVILGQDPYHGAGQAHGLCFSVRKGVRTPPSLRNIYTELTNEYGADAFTAPSHGHLAAWAAQGVLLLNAALTVRAGQANSHAKRGWETFTERVIEVPTGVGRGVVFLAWGKAAAARVAKLDKVSGGPLSRLFIDSHPSPLATASGPGFVGNGHFKKANAWLDARYGPAGTVDWCAISAGRE